jgi:hypothetical protein
MGATIAQSVSRLATSWTTKAVGVRIQVKAKFLTLFRPDLGVRSASYPVGTGWLLPLGGGGGGAAGM